MPGEGFEEPLNKGGGHQPPGPAATVSGYVVWRCVLAAQGSRIGSFKRTPLSSMAETSAGHLYYTIGWAQKKTKTKTGRKFCSQASSVPRDADSIVPSVVFGN
jgi:hypothetical protein